MTLIPGTNKLGLVQFSHAFPLLVTYRVRLILFPKVPYLTLKYVGSLYSTRFMSTNTKILSVVVPICRGSLMRGILIYDGTFTFSILLCQVFELQDQFYRL